MAGRREAREQALQALYQLDMAGSEPDWGRLHGSDDLQAFTRELVEGVRTNRERIDALIAGSAEHWRLPRSSRGGLNPLRPAPLPLPAPPPPPPPGPLNQAHQSPPPLRPRGAAAPLHRRARPAAAG